MNTQLSELNMTIKILIDSFVYLINKNLPLFSFFRQQNLLFCNENQNIMLQSIYDEADECFMMETLQDRLCILCLHLWLILLMNSILYYSISILFY